MGAGVTYQWEPFSACVREALPLLYRHRDEIEDARFGPLDPDYDVIFTWERLGAFRVFTAREEGVLVGYIAWLVFPHPFFRTKLTARTQVFWLDPAHRSGWTGYRLFKNCLSGLKELGVQNADFLSRPFFEAARGGLALIFSRLGAQLDETGYRKWL
jgi:hypothetical protein